MASNVINDPMAAVMQSYIETQRAELPVEITLVQEEKSTKSKGKNKTDIQFNSTKSTASSSNTYCKQLDSEENVEDTAPSVAYSYRSGGISALNEDNSDADSQISTISQLAKKRAVTISRAEKDQDYDSLEDENQAEKQIKKVVQDEEASHASSLTNLTNNTRNQAYHKSSDSTVGS